MRERLRLSQINTESLIHRLQSLYGKGTEKGIINDQTQLGMDGKLLWVERYATPQGWMVVLSPSAFTLSQSEFITFTGNVEGHTKGVVSSDWVAYYTRCTMSLEKRKLSWSPQELESCFTEQNVYDARLIRSLLQDESVRMGVLPKPPATQRAAFTPKVPTLTFFQQRILRMVSWVERIIANHGGHPTAHLSGVGVVCTLYRLVEYAKELEALPPWKETDCITWRIQACVRALYNMLRTSCNLLKNVVINSPPMTEMGLQDPVEMVDTLLSDTYIKLVVMDFSWLLFANEEIPRGSDYLIHRNMYTVLWWHKDLTKYLHRYTQTTIHKNTPFVHDNYRLLKLLRESVHADGKITLSAQP